MVLIYLTIMTKVFHKLVEKHVTFDEMFEKRIEVSAGCNKLRSIEKIISMLLDICYTVALFYCAFTMSGRDDYVAVFMAIIALGILKKFLSNRLMRDSISTLYEIDVILADYMQMSMGDFGQTLLHKRGITTE